MEIDREIKMVTTLVAAMLANPNHPRLLAGGEYCDRADAEAVRRAINIAVEIRLACGIDGVDDDDDGTTYTFPPLRPDTN
tara:strand:- start:543 stop:782 length:240 start_codon:yes stop_codon:yes gene_type:complete